MDTQQKPESLLVKEYWGYHLILDVTACDKDRVKDQDYLKSWVKDMVVSIGMVAYGDPLIVHFGKDVPHLSGNTLVQLIETSNITVHFCDHSGDAYMDIFSCKEFSIDTAIAHVQKWFNPESIRPTFIIRQA